MAIASYSDLQAKIRLWSERNDLSNDILDDFIFMTESTAMNNLRVPAMENTEVIAATDSTLIIPFDYLQLRRLSGPDATDGPVLQYIPWDGFVNLIHNATSPSTTNLRYYSRQGSRWFVYPEVADGTEFTCHYYRVFPTLSTLQPTNWLLELSPQAYLYGCLQHTFEFLMDQERAVYWEDKFMKELSIIQDMADKAEHRGSLLSVQPVDSGSVT